MTAQGRAEKLRRQVARIEGELSAIEEDAARAREELRELLDCAPGEEADAVRALREEVEERESELESLVERLEGVVEGR